MTFRDLIVELKLRQGFSPKDVQRAADFANIINPNCIGFVETELPEDVVKQCRLIMDTCPDPDLAAAGICFLISNRVMNYDKSPDPTKN